jgi:hypothetical protein
MVPDVQLVPLRQPSAVTLAGYFSDHASVGYSATAAAPVTEAQRGLRWPRQGFCVALEERLGCLHLGCETVKGFSGAPVFLNKQPMPDQPLEVVGFVSRPNTSKGHGCGHVEGQVTLSVSATQVQ